MRQRASAKSKSRSSAIWGSRMSHTRRFVVCIRNDGYPAALETRKLYETLPDLEAEKHGQLRVIDESGEDYLYPEELFVPLRLPKSVRDALVNVA